MVEKNWPDKENYSQSSTECLSPDSGRQEWVPGLRSGPSGGPEEVGGGSKSLQEYTIRVIVSDAEEGRPH